MDKRVFVGQEHIIHGTTVMMTIEMNENRVLDVTNGPLKSKLFGCEDRLLGFIWFFLLLISIALSILAIALGNVTFYILRRKVGESAARLWMLSATFLSPFFVTYAVYHCTDSKGAIWFWSMIIAALLAPYTVSIIVALLAPYVVSIFAAKR